MRVPFSVLPFDETDTDFDDRYGGAVIIDDMPSTATPPSSPHVGVAGIALFLIGLKYFSEANFLTTDVKEAKVSAFSTISIGLQALLFIVLFKVMVFKLAATTPNLWGVQDLAQVVAFI